MSDMLSQNIREQILDDPIRRMPGWTVALLDPVIGALPRRAIDVEGTRLYSRAIVDAGAPGVLFAASTGWGHVRTTEEHTRTLEVGGSVDLGHTIKQALIRIEDPVDFNIELMQKLKSWGYGVLWTRRGSNLSPDASDEAVIENLLEVVEAAAYLEMPLGIYSITTVDGAPFRASAARALLERIGREKAKYIVGVKITEPSFENSTREYLDDPTFRNKKIVQGWDAFYAKALQAGRRPDGSNQCGATSGAAACMVYAYEKMYDLARAGEWEALSEVQDLVTQVFNSMQGSDKSKFPDLQIAKRVMGLGHPLTEERTLDEAGSLVTAIERLDKAFPGNEAVRLIAESLLIMGENSSYASPFYERLSVIAED